MNIKNGIEIDSAGILQQLQANAMAIGNTMESTSSIGSKKRSIGARFRTLQSPAGASYHNKSMTKLSHNGSLNKFTIHNIIVKKNLPSTPRLPENWQLPPITRNSSATRLPEAAGDIADQTQTNGTAENANSTVGLLQQAASTPKEKVR